MDPFTLNLDTDGTEFSAACPDRFARRKGFKDLEERKTSCWQSNADSSVIQPTAYSQAIRKRKFPKRLSSNPHAELSETNKAFETSALAVP
jgi:hypothetical protein